MRLNASPQAPPIIGTIDRIGEIIDPNEHMALLAGLVNNPNDRLHAGQFISATVELPPETDVVEIPTRALVEDGDESVVFVQTDPDVNRFTIRRVAVVRRQHDVVYIRSHIADEQRAQGLEALSGGDRVVVAGAAGAEGRTQGTTGLHKPDEGR